jgi:hypothetical protein
MSKTFGILSISYRRPEVLELWCASIVRIRTELDMFIPCVVVGDAEHYEICSKYHIHFIPQENHPATRKWNRGMDYLINELGLNYAIISGSDDIMSTDLVKNLMTEMEKGTDLIGIKTVYFYSADGKQRGQVRRLDSTQILGVARTLSARLVKETGVVWKEDKSWGMDAVCARSIGRYVKSIGFVDGVVVDVKNRESLNKFSMWQGRLNQMISPREFYSILSEDELRCLIKII